MNILDNEEVYSHIVLNGHVSPGTVTLSGHNRRTEWDVKAGPFLQGAITTYKSTPPIEFSASFYLCRDEFVNRDDFTDWDNFVQVIKATVQGRIPKAVPIYHPDLVRNEITSVVKAEIGGMQYDLLGGATIVVKFQEYKPPRIIGGTLKGSGGDDPNKDLKQELQKLTTQYQNTPWG